MVPRPLYDRVLVRREKEDEKIGSFFIPDSGKEKPQQGIVLAVGNGAYQNGVLIPLAVKVSDRVLFGKYSGTEIKLDGETVLILREDEIFVVLDSE